MPRKAIGVVLIAVGILIALVALGADAIGIGNRMGIGWKQILGAVVGVIIAVIGAGYWRSRHRSS